MALVGVPRRTGRGSFNILEILLQAGYPGPVYPVNPNAEEILGVRAYPSVSHLPQAPELAIIMIPRRGVPGVLQECARKGVRGAILVSDGFAEADQEGKELQQEVMRVAQAGGVRLLGPNSLGVVNHFSRFISTFLPVPQALNPVALVSQSGGFFAGFPNFVAGKAVDLGNMADVDHSDALEYLARDPQIKVIALHIEGTKDGRRFFTVARRVAPHKPVIVLKPGRSPQAQHAMASHTGSLAGREEVFDALVKQAGLLRAQNIDEVGDFTTALLHLPPCPGSRLAILTPTGGGAGMALDSLEACGFSLARLSPSTVSRLREFWPPWSAPANPLDMMSPGIMHGYKQVYQASLQALLQDEGVDVVLAIAGLPTLKTVKEAVGGSPKPVACWGLGPWNQELLARIEEVAYRAVFPTPERALRALGALRQFSLRAQSPI